MSDTECPECDETVPVDDLCCGKCVLKAIRRELRKPQTPTTGINAVIGAIPDAEEPPPKHDHEECHRILRGVHALEKERDDLAFGLTCAQARADQTYNDRVEGEKALRDEIDLWRSRSKHFQDTANEACQALQDTRAERDEALRRVGELVDEIDSHECKSFGDRYLADAE